MWRLPENYQEFSEQEMPFTAEESLGTFYSEWIIEDWPNLESRVHGPTFQTDKQNWNVLLFPKGNGQQEHISLYLENEACRNNSSQDVCAQFILCLVDPTDPTRFFHKASQHRFNEYEADWGFTQFIEIEKLTQEYIVNNSVKLVCIVRLIKDSTGVLWHKFYNYDSKKMTGHVGLLNQGATCYMNSLFQSLFFTNLYRKAVFQIPTENENPRNSISLALQRLFYSLQFSNQAVSTTELTQSFGWDSVDSFMQHDVQEFNRLLQDNLEKKMQGTPAEDMIRKLFMGKTKSYIKCINVDYESSRIENYYDIQLNVKGCADLYSSFKDYIQEETLEGDNKYMANNYGLQDAKKGVIFESFPPVLHLQLKRFEYDMMKDMMVKINDRYEFPSEIDLSGFVNNQESGESFKYILHGVLVHAGDLMGGHYFAFVRPTKQDEWFKFDDDRVTPASKREVLEENYGGIDSNNNHMRVTNAYMLVYVRETLQEDILRPVTQADIPSHLVERIAKENELLRKIEKERAEQHLYMRAYIVREQGFLMNQGPDFIQFDETVVTEPPIVEVRQVFCDQKFKDFLMEYPNARAWNIMNRKNGTVRVQEPFGQQDLELSIKELITKISNIPVLRIFIESPVGPIIDDKTAMIFVKVFDPSTQTLTAIGRTFINKNSLISSIEKELNKMIGYDIETRLDIYEEIDFTLVVKLDNNTTFEKNKIENGDILCVQKSQSEEEIQELISRDLHTNATEYLNYLLNRINVLFMNEERQFYLELAKNMTYDEMINKLSKCIQQDKDYVEILLPNRDKIPRNMKLIDIVQLTEYLYYRILPIKSIEIENNQLLLLKPNVCYPTLNTIQQNQQVMISKASNIKTFLDEIEPKDVPKRIYFIKNHLISREYKLNELIQFNLKERDQDNLYIEIIPKEEFNKTEDDFYINVIHYQQNLKNLHSIPFKFMVIKDEPFSKTKMRLKERIGLSDIEINKINFNIISKFVMNIKDDEFRLSDYQFQTEDLLGLDYQDPHSVLMTERKLFIKS